MRRDAGELPARAETLRGDGQTVMLLAIDGKAAGLIGVADPVSVMIETYGTGKVDERRLSVVVRELFPLRPAEIITHLDLLRPIYRKTAAYGHFGRKDSDFTWERTDKASDLRAAF